VLVQLMALSYGIYTVWQARPLYLVMEKDLFKVVSAANLADEIVGREMRALPGELQPKLLSGPITVAIREPKDDKERMDVMMESLQGGRDYAYRPGFYLPYEGANAIKSLRSAKPLEVFLSKQPSQSSAASALAKQKGADISQWLYVPVVARQDWVAILNRQGLIEGFLPGDGF
jgi:hypothetical protein